MSDIPPSRADARLRRRRRCVGLGEMRAGDDDRLGARDIGLVDVALVERRIGAVLAIEDQRERLVVADAEQHQRCQAVGVGVHAGDVHALARALLADEAAHVFVADARDEPAPETEPRRADSDVGRAAADSLGEARHVLEPAANLGAIEVDRRAAYGDDVERRVGQARAPGRNSGRRAPDAGVSRSGLERRVARADDVLVEVDIRAGHQT